MRAKRWAGRLLASAAACVGLVMVLQAGEPASPIGASLAALVPQDAVGGRTGPRPVLAPVLDRRPDAASPAGPGEGPACEAGAPAPGEAIVPGDRIALRVFEVAPGGAGAFERADLSGSRVVDADGTLSAPLAGRAPAAGAGLACLETRLAARLAAAAGAPLRISAAFEDRPPVAVRGVVRAPGTYRHAPGLTVGRLIALAGAPIEGGGAADPASAAVSARAVELDRLVLGLTVERARLDAMLSGAESLEMRSEAARRAARALGADRIEAERAAVAAHRALLAAEARTDAARAAAHDAAVARAADRLATLDAQLAESQARFDELEELRRRGVAAMFRVDDVATRHRTVERARLDAALALDEARAKRAAAAEEALLRDAARRETLAEARRALAEEIDGLGAQRAALAVQQAALGAPGGALRLTIRRREDGRARLIEASPETPVAPGDVVTVELAALAEARLQ